MAGRPMRWEDARSVCAIVLAGAFATRAVKNFGPSSAGSQIPVEPMTLTIAGPGVDDDEKIVVGDADAEKEGMKSVSIQSSLPSPLTPGTTKRRRTWKHCPCCKAAQSHDHYFCS